ncbi:MAG TPA: PLD nuclease N-terminal domain-containing protein [Nocardioides sp.]|nr:PLD nuclease N-terminal domain-containing protein [Nocardioides sp.]
MVKLQLILAVAGFALWVYCLVSVISTTEDRVRHLPKVAWILIVLFFPFIGSVAWLVAGRPRSKAAPRTRHVRAAPEFPEYDRPGRAAASDPARDEDFLRKVRERAEEQRRRYEQSKKADPDEEPESR